MFLQDLIETKRASDDETSAEPCEVCSTDEQFVDATVVCVDCSQKLCEQCSLPYKEMTEGAHDVRPLGAQLTPEVEQTQSGESFAAVETDMDDLTIGGKLMFVFL